MFGALAPILRFRLARTREGLPSVRVKRLHQTSIEGQAGVWQDCRTPAAPAMSIAAAPLEIHRLPLGPAVSKQGDRSLVTS